MAKQSSAQMIGRRGQRWFESQLPHNWLVQEPRNNDDASIDYTITLADDSQMSGLHFRVQVRTKLRTTVTDGYVTLANVKRSSILDWLVGTTPTLLVLYDCERNCGYCEWVNLLINEDKGLVLGKSKTTTIRMPTKKCLPDAWKAIADELAALNGMVIHTVLYWRLQHLVLSTIGAMAIAYQTVAMTTVAEPKSGHRTQEQSTLLLETEAKAHRQVVRTAVSLVKLLTEMGATTEGLGDWIDNYLATCRTFATNFDDAIESDVPTDMMIATGLMDKRRSWLLFQQVILIEIMVKITMSHLPQGTDMSFLLQRPYPLIPLTGPSKADPSNS